MAMPAIYTTVQTLRELHGELGGRYDPYDATLQQFSTQIADLMQRAQGPLDVNGAPEMWSDPQQLVVFQPIPFA
jgi:hypothetical protein